MRLEPSFMPAPDAIVVLSEGRPTPPGPASVSEWRDADRFFGDVSRFEAERASCHIFTGAIDPFEASGITEGDVSAGHPRAMGMPGDAILVSGDALNAVEEAREVAAVLHDAVGLEPPATVLLVTSVLHMPRTATIGSRASLRVIAHPVDSEHGPQPPLAVMAVIPTAEAPDRTRYVLHEPLARFSHHVPREASSAMIDPA